MNIVFLVFPFACAWHLFFTTQITPLFSSVENVTVIVLYAFLYASFANLYGAYAVAFSPVSDLIYSQSLAAALSDILAYPVILLFARGYVDFRFLLLVLLAQIFLSATWSFAAHRVYFAFHPPLKTVLVWNAEENRRDELEFCRENLEKIGKRFEIAAMDTHQYFQRTKQGAWDVQAVFLFGVHGQAREKILKDCISGGKLFYCIPEISDMILLGAKPAHLFYRPFVEISAYQPSPFFLFAKRCFDIFFSSLALFALFPFMAAIAFAVKRDGGSVFYRQERLTKNGKVFWIFKFRSMSMDAEEDGVARLSSGERDMRVTPIGHILRRYRLDELPQLINILRGEMSFVGPRPERPEIARAYEQEFPEFALRLQAKAGLTGYAQVYGKYNTTPYDKLLMDLRYLAHPSLLSDLKIIFATVKVLFKPESTEGVAPGKILAGKGADSERK